MRGFLHIPLILVLILTGIGLGTARGTVQIGGQMVLCTAAGIVVVPHPGQGTDESAHICPDMALLVLVQPDQSPSEISGSAATPHPADWRLDASRSASRATPGARVRDPPIDMSLTRI